MEEMEGQEKERKETKEARAGKDKETKETKTIEGLRKRENRLLRKISAKGGDFLYFIDAAITVVEEFDPSEPEQKGSGRRYFPIKPRIIARLIQQEYNLSYREIELLIRENRILRDKLGITQAPDHNTLQRTISLVKEEDLKNLKERISGYKDLLERELKL